MASAAGYLSPLRCCSYPWMVTLMVQNRLVEFKMDTGAAVTAITEETYHVLEQPKLVSAQKNLCGPAQQRLEVLGLFEENLTSQQKSALTEIYMVRGLKTNLLGLPAITALHLLEKLCAVTDQDIREQYPKVLWV